MTEPRKTPGKCPLCKKVAVPEHTPFCSKGCKDRDLLKWLNNGYSVPGEPAVIPDNEID